MAKKKPVTVTQLRAEYQAAIASLGLTPLGGEAPGRDASVKEWRAVLKTVYAAVQERDAALAQVRAEAVEADQRARADRVTDTDAFTLGHLARELRRARETIAKVKAVLAESPEALFGGNVCRYAAEAGEASAKLAHLHSVEEAAQSAGLDTPEARLAFVRMIDVAERTHDRLVTDALKVWAFWPHSTGPGENLWTLCQGAGRVEVIETLAIMLEQSAHLRAKTTD